MKNIKIIGALALLGVAAYMFLKPKTEKTAKASIGHQTAYWKS